MTHIAMHECMIISTSCGLIHGQYRLRPGGCIRVHHVIVSLAVSYKSTVKRIIAARRVELVVAHEICLLFSLTFAHTIVDANELTS